MVLMKNSIVICLSEFFWVGIGQSHHGKTIYKNPHLLMRGACWRLESVKSSAQSSAGCGGCKRQCGACIRQRLRRLLLHLLRNHKTCQTKVRASFITRECIQRYCISVCFMCVLCVLAVLQGRCACFKLGARREGHVSQEWTPREWRVREAAVLCFAGASMKELVIHHLVDELRIINDPCLPHLGTTIHCTTV